MWTRPVQEVFPAIYHRFERITKSGEHLKFFVQDATEDMHLFLLDHMEDFFMKGEPMCKFLEVIHETESVEGMKIFWRSMLKQKVTLVCFEEHPDQPGVPINFVGCNILYISQKGEAEPDEIIGYKWKQIYDCVAHCAGKADEVMSNDLYLGAMGLSIRSKYQGMGIGTEILEARTGLCNALNIPITKTVFTNIASQKVAYRAGFKDIVSVDYEGLDKVDPRFAFNIPSTKSIIVMYKKMC